MWRKLWLCGRFQTLKENPLKENPLKENHLKENPLKENPLKENPLKENPLKENPLKENPLKENPLKENPLKENHLKENPLKENPLKENPLKENPLKENPRTGRGHFLFSCRVLLLHNDVTNDSLGAALSARLAGSEALLGAGLRLHGATQVSVIENAAEVAVQLAVITNNELSNEEVSKVVTKVKQLVSVATINSSLASTVVLIISNVMSSGAAPAATSERALKTVDRLVQKIQFEGPSLSLSSRHLAVGISTFNTSTFTGTSFSAFTAPNTTDPQVEFQAQRPRPLAQVVLPASLLSGSSLSEEDLSSLSRINFLFFSSTNLFQKQQGGRSLNSYVVASSVGNRSIRDLKDPVEIHIAHLSEHAQTHLNPVCMFWDFDMNGGAGGWNAAGCRASSGSSSSRTVCLCDHLTHFGILMDISGASPHIDPKNNKILTFVSYIGCGVSAVFSAATLLTYVAFEKLRRDYPSKILMNLSASLLFLNTAFLLDGWLASLRADWLCLSAAVLLHYFLLTTFTWMGLESLHMYIALVKVFNTYIRRYILKFCLVGWGELRAPGAKGRAARGEEEPETGSGPAIIVLDHIRVLVPVRY
ncbi:G-protein coupled receptor 126 [Liparis tanakae]|uniref:G-protein coupled receptor 126 n=1 Tax=Liparis tanakae TaxID=230148 RepID=A0A4Z2F1B2_9TELE|nr:G-protein coupled receptor 126 [Liparis tanakae]